MQKKSQKSITNSLPSKNQPLLVPSNKKLSIKTTHFVRFPKKERKFSNFRRVFFPLFSSKCDKTARYALTVHFAGDCKSSSSNAYHNRWLIAGPVACAKPFKLSILLFDAISFSFSCCVGFETVCVWLVLDWGL
jgi:hypothetical protein